MFYQAVGSRNTRFWSASARRKLILSCNKQSRGREGSRCHSAGLWLLWDCSALDSEQLWRGLRAPYPDAAKPDTEKSLSSGVSFLGARQTSLRSLHHVATTGGSVQSFFESESQTCLKGQPTGRGTIQTLDAVMVPFSIHTWTEGMVTHHPLKCVTEGWMPQQNRGFASKG